MTPRRLLVGAALLGGCNAISGVGDYREVSDAAGGGPPLRQHEPGILCGKPCSSPTPLCCQEKQGGVWRVADCSGGTCPTYQPWRCDDRADCPAPQVCCANADPVDSTRMNNSSCASGCDVHDVVLCDPGDPAGCPDKFACSITDPRVPDGYGACDPI